MKRALVLSGGGSKGAFEVGAIDYLVHQRRMDFQTYLGTSVGALNVAILGQARNRGELLDQTEKLKAIWLEITGNHCLYDGGLLIALRLILDGALFHPNGLRRLLEEHVDLDRLFDPASVVKVVTVALETGELLYADSRRPDLQADYQKYILASASIPLFFPAVPIAGKHWYDGGLRDMTPLGAVFEENPDEIIVIVTYPLGPKLEPILPEAKPRGALGALLRSLSILTSEIAANDLQLASAINKRHLRFPGRRRVPIRLISPAQQLPGDSALDFSPDSIRENMKKGYEAAQSPRILYY